jgi:DNA-binding CsgD family transcriptional regulator/tetratricopeptide (TPR) repeat protein
VDAVRGGESRVLVVRGDPGVGKTSLLDHMRDRAVGCRVESAAGVQSEMELAFAGLHQLVAPMLAGVGRLSVPQREALETAFGLSAGPPPDRFCVGLAILSLLSDVAEDEPLLCFIDDVHWLDRTSVQVLTFVARRLQAESVGLLFATRVPIEELAGISELVVGGLPERDAQALLDSVLTAPLDTLVRDRVIAETNGNPLALLELFRGLSPAELAGGFGLPRATPIATSVEEEFRTRLDALPYDTRRLLHIAAADPLGDAVILWRAAARLGVDRSAAGPAVEAGLVEVGATLRFRHPLVRSAAYRDASPDERTRVHRALADATDPELDPDRRSWHLAQATAGPDDEVAAELERSAGRAQARGGFAAAAAFLERSAALSMEPPLRARRALAAAKAKHAAGAYSDAADMLRTAEAGPLEEADQADADLLRAEIAYAERRGNDAPELLVRAAKRLEPLDARAARDTYLDAMIAAHFAGRLAPGAGLVGVAEAALGGPRTAQRPTAADLLLDGMATASVHGYVAAVPLLQQAVQAFRSPGVSLAEELRWLWPAAHIAMGLWDDESYDELSTRHVERSRESGLLAVLPTALTTSIVAHAFAGELATADELIAEMRVLSDAMGIALPPYGPLFVAGWRGSEPAAVELIGSVVEEVTARGEGAGLAFADYAQAVLYNGLGRYDAALAATTSIDCFETEGFVIYTAGLVELIEAAARNGTPEQGKDAFQRLYEATAATGTDWALGIHARSRALLASDETAESAYRAAIEYLEKSRIRPQLARAHLVYGEWLRRQNRRVEARNQLRVAHNMLSAMGAEAFAERAMRELAATGETVRKRSIDTATDLTAQERQVARLARDGLSNPEIGARLFISPPTVKYHLRKVFQKLDITSRGELHRVLAND